MNKKKLDDILETYLVKFFSDKIKVSKDPTEYAKYSEKYPQRFASGDMRGYFKVKFTSLLDSIHRKLPECKGIGKLFAKDSEPYHRDQVLKSFIGALKLLKSNKSKIELSHNDFRKEEIEQIFDQEIDFAIQKTSGILCKYQDKIKKYPISDIVTESNLFYKQKVILQDLTKLSNEFNALRHDGTMNDFIKSIDYHSRIEVGIKFLHNIRNLLGKKYKEIDDSYSYFDRFLDTISCNGYSQKQLQLDQYNKKKKEIADKLKELEDLTGYEIENSTSNYKIIQSKLTGDWKYGKPISTSSNNEEEKGESHANSGGIRKGLINNKTHLDDPYDGGENDHLYDDARPDHKLGYTGYICYEKELDDQGRIIQDIRQDRILCWDGNQNKFFVIADKFYQKPNDQNISNSFMIGTNEFQSSNLDILSPFTLVLGWLCFLSYRLGIFDRCKRQDKKNEEHEGGDDDSAKEYNINIPFSNDNSEGQDLGLSGEGSDSYAIECYT